MNAKTLRILEFDKIIKKLLALATSEMGKEIVEALVPEKDINKVTQQLKDTSDGVSCISRRGSPPMGGVHDIRASIKRVDIGSVLSPGELLRISGVLRVSRNLKNYTNDNVLNDENNTVNELINGLQTAKKLEDRIELCIISEEEIADNASPALSSIRRQVKDFQASIKDKLNDMIRSQKYQKFMQESIVTMRGDRYVVPVKQEYRNEVAGMVHDASASGATIFIEPMAVVEANNNIKQLRIKEQLEIERILYELTVEVSNILPMLKVNVEILAKLDFIFAKAKLSLDYNCICPKINDSKSVLIKKGRHPILDSKIVVPIDLWIGRDFKTLVITGPNTGGKTVTLKTLGLFVVMTQAGLHIPAGEGTQMCIFNKVFADIGDEQSIEQSLSTFSSHMKNITKILNEVNENSLVLFDELGAGTDPTEGAALAMAILECLYQVGALTVATTHYSELKIYALSTKGVSNACCEFDVETLKPTYKLLIGVPGKSNAFAISNKLGLSNSIIERAKEFLTQEDVKFEDMLLSIEKNRSEAEKEKTRAEIYRIEAEKLKNDLEEQKRKIEVQKDKMLRDAKESARKVLLEAKHEAEGIVAEMKRMSKEQESAERTREAEELRLKLKSKINTLEESLSEAIMPKQGYVKPPKGLKAGDSVLIVNLNQKGTVIAPPDKNDEAIIQAGIMKINVHLTNLRLIDEQKEEIRRVGSGKTGAAKSRNISSEIDLRGLNLDEAMDAVDKYLDDASMAGLGEVVLIHGKGTGVLRSGLQQYLRTSPHVKVFRLGKIGEGEAGVTVVELK